ncbi:MAG: hypothetical protein ACR2PA_07790 [Hyphomicrobiaceae bacterium]
MDISTLARSLKKTAGVLRAAGAKQQTAAVDAVGQLVSETDHETVEEFVDQAVEQLNRPSPKDMPPEEIVSQLRSAGTDDKAFEALFQAMRDRAFAKDKVMLVASLYTGARKTAWSTKPQALKAIREKFDDSVFLASKAAANENVTPW